jgi:hypothetical protein
MNYRKVTAGILFSSMFLAMMAANEGKAQTANAGANAGANSSAGSQSGSNSGAAAVINQTTNVPANTTSTNTTTLNQNERVSGGTNSTLNQNQSGYTTSDVTLRTTPTVYAPPVSGGNPCTLAVSGGVSVIGWGASAGGTFVDQDCANRQKIAMIWNAGFKGPAKELMCNDKDSYNAFKTAGEPCAFRAAYEPQGAAPQPTMQQQPAPVSRVTVTPTPMVQAAPKNYPRCNARLGIVDNCAS